MHATTLLLVGFLLGQPAVASPQPSGNGTVPPADLRPIAAPRLQPIAGDDVPQPSNVPQPGAARTPPPELVAEALAERPGSELTGRPMTLAAALAAAPDRSRQLAVVHAYWRLVETVAVYNLGLDYRQQLETLQAGAKESIRLQTELASARAMVGGLRVSAVAAQHDLAAMALLSPESELPLPTDRPHVGPYLTRIGELFSKQPAPARAKLIDLTLPLRRRVIEDRASALHVAAEALSAAEADLQSGRGDLAAVLDRTVERLQQRRALIESVGRYNHDIADYAAIVAAPAAGGRAFLAMLIEPAPAAVGSPASGDQSGVRQTRLDEPVPTPAKRPEKKPAKKNVPTLAPPRQGVPTLAPPLEEEEPPKKNEPTLAPPLKEPETPAPNVWKARKPLVDVENPSKEPAAESALYSALESLSPGSRAKQLAIGLHSHQSLGKAFGEPLSLETCLDGAVTRDRQAVIEAYWLAAQRAAAYRVLARQASRLKELASAADTKSARQRIRSATYAADATLSEARIALLQSQYELALLIDSASEEAWPIPSTIPHSGWYLPKLQSQPRRLAESWPLRRLAAMIPGLAETVQRSSTAVVAADKARAAAAQDYRAGDRSIEPVLKSIRRQSRQTLAFLEKLTAYNRAIAEYALAVLPPETSNGKFVEALVVVD